MTPQDLDRQRMKRAHPRDAFRGLAQNAANAQFHFACGFVGEGHRQNLVRAGFAHGQKMHNPRDQRLGLARTRPCQHQHRAIQRLNRLALGGVQVIQIGRGAGRKRAARQGDGIKWIGRVGHAPDPSVNCLEWKAVFHFCSDRMTMKGRRRDQPPKGCDWPKALALALAAGEALVMAWRKPLSAASSPAVVPP